MNLDDFASSEAQELALLDPDVIFVALSGYDTLDEAETAPQRCEICLKLGVGNGSLEDLGDCPICYRYTRLNSNGTCGREDCSRLWKRAKRQARRP